MLFHPVMLEAMAQAISEERAWEAELMRAAHANHARRGSPVRSWLARTLLRAALRLDANMRDIPQAGTADFAR